MPRAVSNRGIATIIDGMADGSSAAGLARSEAAVMEDVRAASFDRASASRSALR